MNDLKFWPPVNPDPHNPIHVGFRLGEKGTHTSRTMMLGELSAAFLATPSKATRSQYAEAAIDGNCFGKATVATRRLTNQRLGELYGLDPEIVIFRILRDLWEKDDVGRPLLAVLIALARDPLLIATAQSVISLRPGAEFVRDEMKFALRRSVGDRLKEGILDKVVRNAASSWAQSGHLAGRTFKRRQPVQPTPAAVALAMYLANAVGFRGADLLSSGWVAVLDCLANEGTGTGALCEASQDFSDLRMGGDVFELSLDRLDPWTRRLWPWDALKNWRIVSRNVCRLPGKRQLPVLSASLWLFTTRSWNGLFAQGNLPLRTPRAQPVMIGTNSILQIPSHSGWPRTSIVKPVEEPPATP